MKVEMRREREREKRDGYSSLPQYILSIKFILDFIISNDYSGGQI